MRSSQVYKILLLAYTFGLILADETNPDTTRAARVLKDFFEFYGINFDVSNTKLIGSYNEQVIEEMEARYTSSKDTDYLGLRRYNGEINKLIYETQIGLKPAVSSGDKDIDAQLAALELIVPDSLDDPVIKKAKAELLNFLTSHRKMAEELLARIGGPMKRGDLNTIDAIRILKNIYYHWVPLALLADYIEKDC